MVDPVTGWVEITPYNDKRAIPIGKLVETTWMSRYSGTTEIMYDQVSECIGHEFRKSLIEMEYRIVAKPITSRNPMSNVILEWIQ